MNQTLAAIIAVATTASVASAQNYVAIESAKGSTVGEIQTSTITGFSDLDATATYDSSYQYGGPYIDVIDNEAADYPTDLLASDGKYFSLHGNDDQFLRMIGTAVIPNTDNVASTAFAFRIDSLDAVATNNDTDYWRVLDVTNTGTGASIVTFTVRDSQLRVSTNGITATNLVDLNTLTVGTWYVLVSRYDRTTDGAGTFDAFLINQATKAQTTVATLTSLTATNKTAIRTLSTVATLTAPTGTAAFTTSLDNFAIYSNALSTAQLLTAAKADFGLNVTAEVSDWNLF